MRVGSIAKTGLHLVAGCSLVLLVGTGAGTAFAHGGGGGHGGGTHLDHRGNGGHGRCVDCGDGDWEGNGEHHHHPTMAGNPPLHGPGSSHDPIVHHPVHGPGSSHNPIVTPVTVVRDHRTPPPRPNRYCNHHNITGCEVRDHRTPPAPQCFGDLC